MATDETDLDNRDDEQSSLPGQVKSADSALLKNNDVYFTGSSDDNDASSPLPIQSQQASECDNYVNQIIMDPYFELVSDGLCYDRDASRRTVINKNDLTERDICVVEYIKNYQDNVVLASDTADCGKLFLIKHLDFCNIFRIIAVHKAIGDDIQALQFLYNGFDPQKESIVKCWNLGRLDFTFYLYDHLLKKIATLSTFLKIDNDFFFCKDRDYLMKIIEDIICERRIAYFI